MTDSYSQGDDDGFPVLLASGAPFKVMIPEEVAYVEDRVNQYKTTYRWENVSDIQDVDRLIIMELLCYRWGHWLAAGKDWWGEEVADRDLKKNLNDTSTEIRQVKKALGIDKATRDKETDEASVSAYLEKLRQRAREFGIVREEQVDEALKLIHGILAMYQLHINCDDVERRQQRCEAEDVIDYIGTVVKPKFEEVDAYFRSRPDGQHIWRGTL